MDLEDWGAGWDRVGRLLAAENWMIAKHEKDKEKEEDPSLGLDY